ncbi:RtcB family protein [Anaerosphaera multitolerans]|uniref:3'-phosphate/5'-hydroxy nucleic acid ligase n=1 Tax=Anaerosphaera multitolerans TaxID=2487351 RepID=A0A437S468_9FIRM|nr:RtcB family protein [Anaerosphaera multitolerans]RVU53814.1 RNA-splicing ligase RtcB [Anaerosphaera multitolerans]
MIELKGKYNSAKVFANEMEEVAKQQIIKILDQSFLKDTVIRIMPDVHAGKGSVIGFTCRYTEENIKIVPNIVGVDIGCGVLTTDISNIDINRNLLEKLDSEIRDNDLIPYGFNVNKKLDSDILGDLSILKGLRCYDEIEDMNRIKRSLGTLGGGNHFIEIAQGEKSKKTYLIIHSGSRNLGKQVADLYQNKAIEYHGLNKKKSKGKKNVVTDIKGEQKEKESSNKVDETLNMSKDLAYLEGFLAEEYLHDMAICQKFAVVNRKRIRDLIYRFLCESLNLSEISNYGFSFETIHNYYDFEDKTIRKGAVASKRDQLLLIPINMQYGSLLCRGLGNKDWNDSAPHGAGRLMSRRQAKKQVTLREFELSMEGIFSTSVHKDTIDESPHVYKNPQDIIEKIIGSTVEIVEVLRPIYNFKG